MPGAAGAVGVAEPLAQGQRVPEQPERVVQFILAERQAAQLVGEERLGREVPQCLGRAEPLAQDMRPGLPPPGDEQYRAGDPGQRGHRLPVALVSGELDDGQGRIHGRLGRGRGPAVSGQHGDELAGRRREAKVLQQHPPVARGLACRQPEPVAVSFDQSPPVQRLEAFTQVGEAVDGVDNVR